MALKAMPTRRRTWVTIIPCDLCDTDKMFRRKLLMEVGKVCFGPDRWWALWDKLRKYECIGSCGKLGRLESETTMSETVRSLESGS